jgi:seryl-tRNA synthetase
MSNKTFTLSLDPIVPDFLIDQVQSKMAYLDEAVQRAVVSTDGSSMTLYLFKDLDEAAQKALEKKIHRILSAMVSGALKPRTKILEDKLDRKLPYKKDPMDTLLETGDVYKEGKGMYVLGPLVAGLVEYFNQECVGLAASFDARHYRFPVLISPELLEKVDYFRSFPHSLNFVRHLREDLDKIESFAEQAHCEHGHLTAPEETQSEIEAMLSPAVCFHLYEALNGSTLDEGVKATAVGHCFRYESSNLTSLTRLWDFTMYEVIFVGEKDFVLENREEGRKRAQKMYDRWGLAYRVESANDPFFVGEFKKQAAFQSAFQLKYEVRAALPFANDTLAVASYNYHQDFFGRKMQITAPDGKPAHTGCVAFGLERLAFAFLAQYGFERKAWPADVRRALKGV